MNKWIMLAVVLGYFPGMLILLRLSAYAHKKVFIDKKLEKMPRNRANAGDLPKPVWPAWSARLKFTFKDGRPIKVGGTHRNVFLGIFAGGLLFTIVTGMGQNWKMLPPAYSIFFGAVTFSMMTAKPVLDIRESIVTRMFEIGASKGLLAGEYSANPQAVVNIKTWVDYVKPTKVEFKVRTEFSSMGEESFLQQFNQIFGTETSWVPSDDPEKGTPGWNYDEGKVTLHSVPPLPNRASWDESYVLDPGIAWSFFPIALGIENGIERPNPKTGETEWILGFDLSGEAAKTGQKAGYVVSGTVTTSPMCFIGGGTGGGKSLASDTIVHVFEDSEVCS